MGRFSLFFLMLSSVLIAGCAGSVYKAAGDGDVFGVKALAEKGEDINAFYGTIRLYTPLMNAAMQGRMDAAAALLELGADPLAEDEDGLTAAQLARKRGYDDIARMLDEAEAKRRAVLGPNAPVARPPSSKPEDAEFVQPPPSPYDDKLTPIPAESGV